MVILANALFLLKDFEEVVKSTSFWYTKKETRKDDTNGF